VEIMKKKVAFLIALAMVLLSVSVGLASEDNGDLRDFALKFLGDVAGFDMENCPIISLNVHGQGSYFGTNHTLVHFSVVFGNDEVQLEASMDLVDGSVNWFELSNVTHLKGDWKQTLRKFGRGVGDLEPSDCLSKASERLTALKTLFNMTGYDKLIEELRRKTPKNKLTFEDLNITVSYSKDLSTLESYLNYTVIEQTELFLGAPIGPKTWFTISKNGLLTRFEYITCNIAKEVKCSKKEAVNKILERARAFANENCTGQFIVASAETRLTSISGVVLAIMGMKGYDALTEYPAWSVKINLSIPVYRKPKGWVVEGFGGAVLLKNGEIVSFYPVYPLEYYYLTPLSPKPKTIPWSIIGLIIAPAVLTVSTMRFLKHRRERKHK
jgi:hypothetical protein